MCVINIIQNFWIPQVNISIQQPWYRVNDILNRYYVLNFFIMKVKTVFKAIVKSTDASIASYKTVMRHKPLQNVIMML